MSEFTKHFSAVQNEAHLVNVMNGWWNDRIAIDNLLSASPELRHVNKRSMIISLLGLVDSEVAEAMEAVRKHDEVTWSDSATKDTLVRELGGAIVRIMDIAQFLDLPLAAGIEAEIESNKTRGIKHGGKAV